MKVIDKDGFNGWIVAGIFVAWFGSIFAIAAMFGPITDPWATLIGLGWFAGFFVIAALEGWVASLYRRIDRLEHQARR